jgi:hypothetical protein
MLASAIEYAAQRKLSPSEHQRFFVTHYADQAMELARREAVSQMSATPFSPSAISTLEAIAARLRTS